MDEKMETDSLLESVPPVKSRKALFTLRKLLCLGISIVAIGSLCLQFFTYRTKTLPLSWRVGQPVQTTSGTVVGTHGMTVHDVSLYAGIPFAQPPVGQLRFASPRKYRGHS